MTIAFNYGLLYKGHLKTANWLQSYNKQLFGRTSKNRFPW